MTSDDDLRFIQIPEVEAALAALEAAVTRAALDEGTTLKCLSVVVITDKAFSTSFDGCDCNFCLNNLEAATASLIDQIRETRQKELH